MRVVSAGITLLALLAALPARAEPVNLSGIREDVSAGLYYTAEQKLEGLLEKDRENAEGWALLAEIRLTMPNPDLDGAETAAVRALDLVDDESAEYWKLLGRVWFEKGVNAYSRGLAANVITSCFADAEAKFAQAFRRNPDDPEIRWRMGWAKEWQGEVYQDDAKKLYREQIEKFPEEPGGYVRLGGLLSTRANNATLAARKLEGEKRAKKQEEAEKTRAEAIALFDEGLEKAGANAELLHLKGLALEWKGQRPAAKECYYRAIQADPGFNKVWTRLNELREPKESLLAAARKVLKKSPRHPTAATWAGYCLNSLRRYEESLSITLPALKACNENTDVYTQTLVAAGELLGSKQKAAAGVAALERIHEYYPWAGAAANNLGLYHRDRTNDYRKSLDWYLKAVEREPDNQDIVNDAALVYLFYFDSEQMKRKSRPMFEHVVSLVVDEGYAPQRGYWDALENLCKYFWEVEHDAKKVVRYAKMRYEPINGGDPYNMSQKAKMWGMMAKRELEKASGGGK